jgi:Tfp pilus assembly protein PilF
VTTSPGSEGGRSPRLSHALELHRAGDLEAAALLYELTLRERPENVDARHLLGVARRAQGRAAEAVELIRAALAQADHLADAWYNLGNALMDLSRFAEAASAFTRAGELGPENASTWHGLGLARGRLGDIDGAFGAYRRALSIDPEHLASRNNLANLLIERGKDEEAAVELRRVLASAPELAEAHYNLARALLRLGDYVGGFAEYAWRWRARDFPDRPRRTDLPLWDGGQVRGRVVLVQAEQGLGDTIQMVRLLPLLVSLGAGTVLEVPRQLCRLFHGVTGAGRVVPIGDPVPDAELRIPLFDLPARLRLTLGSIPDRVPYLAPEPDRRARYASRLRPDGRLRVGLCWCGNRRSPADAGRSLEAADPLVRALAADEVRMIALTEPSAHPLVPHPDGLGWRLAEVPAVVEHGGPETDHGPDAFLDTAALLAEIDLVVSTDTAVAHLAGALGRPTLLLLKASPDWRWLSDRADSPWYPTFRLIRQPRAGDWAGVLEVARREVLTAAAGRRGSAG